MEMNDQVKQINEMENEFNVAHLLYAEYIQSKEEYAKEFYSIQEEELMHQKLKNIFN